MSRTFAYPTLFVESDVFGFGTSVIRFSEQVAINEFIKRMSDSGARRVLYLPPLRLETRDLFIAGLASDRRIQAIRTAAAGAGIDQDDVAIRFSRTYMKGEPSPANDVSDWLSSDNRPAAIISEIASLRACETVFKKQSKRVAGILTWGANKSIGATPLFQFQSDYESLGRKIGRASCRERV